MVGLLFCANRNPCAASIVVSMQISNLVHEKNQQILDKYF